ncbi:MAG: serine/threonine-protein kinase [Polyangiaceae bacterium]
MHTCPTCGGVFQASGACPRDNVLLFESPRDPLVGRVLGERYRILDRIGEGGMGAVYRAAHTRIASTFAVKVVWGEYAFDEEMQQRFLREAETASCLSHRSIVRVTDFGTDGVVLIYLVMDYLEGPSLRDVLMRETRLEWRRALRIAARIARGLAHAHGRGVVHRDLKPDNILLVSEDEEEDIVKLLDFGIAVSANDTRKLTRAGMVVGTPNYMAPEQLRAQAVDGRTDLYALGCMLFEMLAGQCPFDAKAPEEIAMGHALKPPPSLAPALAERGAPRELDALVQRLLAKKPDDRFASAKELIKALQGFDLEGQRSYIESAPTSRVPLKSLLPPSQGPVAPAIVGALEATILRGAPMYNAGDHAGCASVYSDSARDIASKFAEHVAVSARLEAALARAAIRTNPTDAAWDLRNAFDDLIFARPSVVEGDALSVAIAAYAAIAARRETEGRFDLLGDYQVMFARALAARLRAVGGFEDAARRLEGAAERGARAGGGESALRQIEPVIWALRSSKSFDPSEAAAASLRTPAITLPSGPPSVAPASRASLPPVSAEVRERITRAIRVGAPLYNGGDVAACARVYREAAAQMVADLERDPSGRAHAEHLRQALLAAAQQPPSQAAWALRFAFDSMLAT